VAVGQVEFTGLTRREADRGLQLRAGLRGADAVVWVWRQRVSDDGHGPHHVQGVAIRVEDEVERSHLRRRWFNEEVRGLVGRSLLLLVTQAALLLLVSVFCANLSGLIPTGETPQEALKSSALGLGMLYAWPVVLLGLLWALRRPQLLPAAGLAVLAATTGRGLILMAAHLSGVWTTGLPLVGWAGCFLLDPFEWAFIVIGLRLSVRAWRLAGDAQYILPQDGPAMPTTRHGWSRAWLGLSGVFALALLGFLGVARH
jgi:hypothetical protein